MFFYRAKPVEAKSKEELLKVQCPICGNQLTHDWFMPIRYSPMALFRLLSFAGALALLLGLLIVKFDVVTTFLCQFSFLTQDRIIKVGLACICLPVAFMVIWGELKVGHLSEDDKHVYGLHCKTCGNGFVGLVDCSLHECSKEESVIQFDNGTESVVDGPYEKYEEE